MYVVCPKCRGQRFLASGFLGVRPVAAFDITQAVLKGDRVDGCWACEGEGRVPEYVVPRIELVERLQSEELAKVLGK